MPTTDEHRALPTRMLIYDGYYSYFGYLGFSQLNHYDLVFYYGNPTLLDTFEHDSTTWAAAAQILDCGGRWLGALSSIHAVEYGRDPAEYHADPDVILNRFTSTPSQCGIGTLRRSEIWQVYLDHRYLDAIVRLCHNVVDLYRAPVQTLIDAQLRDWCRQYRRAHLLAFSARLCNLESVGALLPTAANASQFVNDYHVLRALNFADQDNAVQLANLFWDRLNRAFGKRRILSEAEYLMFLNRLKELAAEPTMLSSLESG